MTTFEDRLRLRLFTDIENMVKKYKDEVDFDDMELAIFNVLDEIEDSNYIQDLHDIWFMR